MGEVIARDVRLMREVAIEVLPETLVKDADRWLSFRTGG
jgi:hypothetical protein